LTERVTRDAHSIDDQLWSALSKQYDEGEIVELVSAIGLFNYFNRFNDALLMEPTK
jgi:alkylhydroperoxidase family enzyme